MTQFLKKEKNLRKPISKYEWTRTQPSKKCDSNFNTNLGQIFMLSCNRQHDFQNECPLGLIVQLISVFRGIFQFVTISHSWLDKNVVWINLFFFQKITQSFEKYFFFKFPRKFILILFANWLVQVIKYIFHQLPTNHFFNGYDFFNAT